MKSCTEAEALPPTGRRQTRSTTPSPTAEDWKRSVTTLQHRHMLFAGKIRDEGISGDMLHSFTAMVSAVRIATALIVLIGNRSSPRTAAGHVDRSL
jgi:hypothetical protein